MRIGCVLALVLSVLMVVASCMMEAEGMQILCAALSLAAFIVVTGLLLDTTENRSRAAARSSRLKTYKTKTAIPAK